MQAHGRTEQLARKALSAQPFRSNLLTGRSKIGLGGPRFFGQTLENVAAIYQNGRMEPGADENAGRLEFAGPGKLVTTDAGTYWFTKHALDQMKIRKLSEGEVLATIEKPDAVVPHPQENRKRSRCYRGNMKAVDVITESRPDRTIVVTAMKRQLNRNERPQL